MLIARRTSGGSGEYLIPDEYRAQYAALGFDRIDPAPDDAPCTTAPILYTGQRIAPVARPDSMPTEQDERPARARKGRR